MADLEAQAAATLENATLAELTAQAGRVAEAQAKLGAARAVLAELERRMGVAKGRLRRAEIEVLAVEADIEDAELRAVEERILAGLSKLQPDVEELQRRQGAFSAKFGMTRPCAVPLDRLASVVENIVEHFHDGRPEPGYCGRTVRNRK